MTNGESDLTINVTIGGIQIPLIVDLGASCNVVGRDEWEHIKSKGINGVVM